MIKTKKNSQSFELINELPVMEHFYTIQGEGFYTGHAAYFIRLGGCDVGCVWCDVKESWDVNAQPIIEVSKIVESAKQVASNICVITGGEPLMHNLYGLTTELINAGKRTHVETSGSYKITGYWNWICVSPKKFKEPLKEVLFEAHELKVVVYNKSDFEWALSFKSKVNSTCKLYLQPEWSKEKEMLPLIINFVKANPEWNISIQVHKYMNIP